MSERETSNKYSRRDALKSIGGLGVAGLFGGLRTADAGSAAASSSAERPNIIMVMTDDHSINALSCYGSRLIDTPNLDRLASEGMLFRHCGVTNSLCAPSRASMLTGKYSHKHGVLQNTFRDNPGLDPDARTFPKLLRASGYTTALVGKWHLKTEPTGFDYWNVLPGQGRYHNPQFSEMGEEREYEGYVTDVITDLAIDTVEKRLSGDAPFLLLKWHKAPHRGWRPEEDHEDLFSDFDMPVPGTFNDDYMNRASAAAHADMRIANMPDWRKQQPEGLSEQEIKHWNYQRYIKNYLRTIVSFDENMGRLLNFLDESGLSDDTIVVYTSDNGFFLGEHGWYDKRFMYEESLHIPLLVRFPAEVPAGRVNEDMVLNIDFAQTFLDYAGVEAPSDMQGHSLRPLLQGSDDADWREAMYYHYYEYPGPHKVHPHYGARTERYKLIHYYTIDEWELFDLEFDPHELNSVYHAPAYAEVREEMTRRLQALRRQYEDDTGEDV